MLLHVFVQRINIMVLRETYCGICRCVAHTEQTMGSNHNYATLTDQAAKAIHLLRMLNLKM
jgi:hypothetical protein